MIQEERAKSGSGRFRKYLHDNQEAAPYAQAPGTFTPWEDVPADTDLMFYEGLHGAIATATVDVVMQLIFTPMILRLMERRRRARGG